jgi:hypothetical protein
MKANELRIGNYIKRPNGARYNGEIKEVNELTIAILRKRPDDGEYLPISLNEEWLLKFGFEWCNEAAGYFDNLHAVYLMYPNVQFHPFCTNDKDCWIELQYVHQLQNLCFALTGKELEIKYNK